MATIAEEKLALWNEGKTNLGARLKFQLEYNYGLTAHGRSHDHREEWCHYGDGSILIVTFPKRKKGCWLHPEKIKVEVCYEEE